MKSFSTGKVQLLLMVLLVAGLIFAAQATYERDLALVQAQRASFAVVVSGTPAFDNFQAQPRQEDVDLAISVNALTQTVNSGEPITYVIQIQNIGIAPASGVIMKVDEPTQFINPTRVSSADYVPRTDEEYDFSWLFSAALEANRSMLITMTGELTSRQTISVPYQVAVTLFNAAEDGNTLNNASTALVSLVGYDPSSGLLYLPQIIRQATPTPTPSPTHTLTPVATATAAPTATSDRRLLHEVNFESDSDGWAEGSADRCSSENRDGRYRLELDTNGDNQRITCWRFADSDSNALSGGFEIKAYPDQADGNGAYGLYINGAGGDEQYLFRIWPNEVDYDPDDDESDPSNDTLNDCPNGGGDWDFFRNGDPKLAAECETAINTGSGSDAANTIRIERLDSDKLELYINGRLIETYDDSDPLEGTGVGIYVRTPREVDYTVKFDDFRRYEEIDD